MAKVFPDILSVEITRDPRPPFSVQCRQVLSTFVTPSLGERARYAEYEIKTEPYHKKINESMSQVKGEARVHGIMCVEIASTYIGYADGKVYENSTFDRLTDTHVQTLAAIEDCYGVKYIQTFLDESFQEHYAMGDNNCGMEINLQPKGIITCSSDTKIITAVTTPGTYDIVGRYTVKLDDRTFDTLRLIYLASEDQMSDFFIDASGREIMHRCFTPDEWGLRDKENTLLSERWPHTGRIARNDYQYVITGCVVPEYVL